MKLWLFATLGGFFAGTAWLAVTKEISFAAALILLGISASSATICHILSRRFL